MISDDGEKVTYIVRGLRPVTLELSAIVGDVLTNLRATLDHLAWQLVISTDASQSADPISDHRAVDVGQCARPT